MHVKTNLLEKLSFVYKQLRYIRICKWMNPKEILNVGNCISKNRISQKFFKLEY